MARVTLDLGEPTGFSAGSWVQWDERAQGLGDLSAFSAVAGEARHLIRLRIFDRAANNIQFQVAETPDGSAGWSGSADELSDAWKQHSAAITVRAAGLDDLVITGPDATSSSDRDATEPYQWSSGNDPTSWFAAYEQAGRPAVTIDVDDGQAVAALDLAGRAAAAVAVRGGLEVAAVVALDLAGHAAAAPAARGAGELVNLAALDLAGRVRVAPALRGGLTPATPLDVLGRAVGAAPALRGRLGIALARDFGSSAALAVADGARPVLARTGDRILDGAESATQRLRDALLVTRGSYPAARDYGSLLVAALDRSLGSAGVGELANAVADAIAHPANGLTDVRLRSVHMTAADGVVVLDIQADWVSQAGTLTPIGLREQLAAG